jgi:hypothetical protein
MIKNVLSLCLLLCFFASGYLFALPYDSWSPGVIVLRSGETIQGEVYFDYHTDVVRCKSAETEKAFAPAQVKYFRLEESGQHKFIPLVYSPRPGYRCESFFEVISKGPINIVRKHNAHKHLTRNPGFMRINPELGFSNDIIGFDYYVQNQDGLRKVKNFRKEFFSLMMQDHKQEIESFVQTHRLRLFQQASQIIVVQYYNYIKDPLKNKWDAENPVAANSIEVR